MPTMITGGQGTSATVMSWGLFALAKHPEVQAKLREELLSIMNERPSLDELNTLTYLDYFVKETMRVYLPVKSMGREAIEDEVIPLSEPVVDASGNLCTSIR
jgi:cytochrome P450